MRSDDVQEGGTGIQKAVLYQSRMPELPAGRSARLDEEVRESGRSKSRGDGRNKRGKSSGKDNVEENRKQSDSQNRDEKNYSKENHGKKDRYKTEKENGQRRGGVIKQYGSDGHWRGACRKRMRVAVGAAGRKSHVTGDETGEENPRAQYRVFRGVVLFQLSARRRAQ